MERGGYEIGTLGARIGTLRTSRSRSAPCVYGLGFRAEWREVRIRRTNDWRIGSWSIGASRRSSGRVRHWLMPARHDDVAVIPLSPVRSMFVSG